MPASFRVTDNELEYWFLASSGSGTKEDPFGTDDLASGSVVGPDGEMTVVKGDIIEASASGDNTVVAAVVGKRIKVLNYTFVAAGAVTVRWKSGASISRSGAMTFSTAGGGASPGYDKNGHFTTAVGQALVMNLSASVGVGGHLTYIEV